MKLADKWEEIRKIFDAAGQSSLHFSVATVDSSGNPHVTPIGSLILRDDYTGYYFEEFPEQSKKNLDQNKKVTIMAVNSDQNFWAEALTSGKFSIYPGMRLFGTDLGRREANTDEINAWQDKVGFAKGLKGHDILWKDMKIIREIKFDGCKPVLCGEMTDHL